MGTIRNAHRHIFRDYVTEPLEGRRLFALVTVTSTSDAINGTTSSIAALIATPGADGISLREAITAANNTGNFGGPDEIRFNISGTGPFKVGPASLLPQITNAVTIDATTQPGYANLPLVELLGSNAALAGNGIAFSIGATGNGSTIRGFSINRWAVAGIEVLSTGNVIEANYIGLDPAGTAALANGVGIRVGATGVAGSLTGNRIGGTTSTQRNVISGNATGVVLELASNGTQILGNYIGTDRTGALARGNTTDGIRINGAPNSLIGSATTGARNVISGNNNMGVSISGPSTSGTIIRANYIGINAAGSGSLANLRGIDIAGSPNTTIGGTTASARNVISGNNQEPIFISGAGATGTIVQGNYVGTNAVGTLSVPNNGALGHQGGILIQNTSLVTIGGAVAGAGNVISGNSSEFDDSGIDVIGSTAITIQGNLIGVTAAGNAMLANAFIGISLTGTTGTQIGGTVPEAHNVIAAGAYGVFDLGGNNNVLEGNYIGTDITGTLAFGNGIGVYSSSPNTRVGGTTTGAGNLISGNITGISIETAAATGAIIQGNFIGTNAAGTAALLNSGDGVAIINAPNALIGGTVLGARNLISGNRLAAIHFSGVTADHGVVQGNYVGTDITGNLSVYNGSFGTVKLENTSFITVGGTAAGAGNVVSGNSGGITGQGIYASNCNNIIIQGNFVGTNAAGTAALRNSFSDISLYSTSQSQIGGTAPGARNIVAAAGDTSGIELSLGDGNVVEGNFIGLDVTGTVGLGTSSYGIYTSSANLRIGGTTASARNVIAGNHNAGLEIAAVASGAIVQGNYFGTNASGTALIGAETTGITVKGQNTTIGGSAAGAGNRIVGLSTGYGISIGGTAKSTTVLGNTIGLNISGNAAVGRLGIGISVDGPSTAVVIGGPTEGARNVIAGCDFGIFARDAVTVRGNYIGTSISGDLAIGNGYGIYLEGSGSSVIGGTAPSAGNVIAGSDTFGVYAGQGGCIVQGNFIGTNASGSAALGNLYGISIYSASGVIGGTVAGARNIISGNRGYGIYVSPAGGSATIQGNYIGTNAAGTTAIPNNGGLFVEGSSTWTVGGTAAGAGNLISGNLGDGIYLREGGVVQGNRIGTDVTGTLPLGNELNGVHVSSGVVGGLEVGAGNVIAFNGAAGIGIDPGNVTAATPILSNSIFSNGLLGIDLGQDGVTLNDLNDTDAGTNGLQNFPTITSASLAGSHTIVSGTLNSTPGASFILQFFYSAQNDSSGYGEGQTLFATRTLFTNAAGNLNFSLDLPTAIPAGSFISMTATTANKTSEFSQAVQIAEVPSFSIADVTVTEGNAGTTAATFTITRSGGVDKVSSVVVGTANGTALAPADYASFPSTIVTFAIGEVSKTITVLVNGDLVQEPNETFTVNLSGAVNATIGDAQAVGTIINDDADATPPAVIASNFNFIGILPTPYEVSFDLSEPAVASPGGVPVLIRRISTGALITTAQGSVTGNRVSAFITQPLPDGDFEAVLPGGSVLDLTGNALPVDAKTPFFILAGDANHDRFVNFDDLLVLAQNYGQSGRTFSQGDFNYDGKIDFDDLLLLAQRYGSSLPALTEAAVATPTITGKPLRAARRGDGVVSSI